MSTKRQRAREKMNMDNYFEPVKLQRPDGGLYDETYPRKTYRVMTSQHDRLKEIAKELGVTLTQVIRFVFGHFIKGYTDGTIKVPIREYVVKSQIIDLEG